MVPQGKVLEVLDIPYSCWFMGGYIAGQVKIDLEQGCCMA